MLHHIKELFGMSHPSPEKMALREMEEARRSLLEAQTGKEYAESMVKYHESRIRRLSRMLNESMAQTSATTTEDPKGE